MLKDKGSREGWPGSSSREEIKRKRATDDG